MSTESTSREAEERARNEVSKLAQEIGKIDLEDLVDCLALGYDFETAPGGTAFDAKEGIRKLYACAKTGSAEAIQELASIAINISQFLGSLNSEKEKAALQGDGDEHEVEGIASDIRSAFRTEKDFASEGWGPPFEERVELTKRTIALAASTLLQFEAEHLDGLAAELRSAPFPLSHFFTLTGFLPLSEQGGLSEESSSTGSIAKRYVIDDIVLRLIEIRLAPQANLAFRRVAADAVQWPIAINMADGVKKGPIRDIIERLELGRSNASTPLWRYRKDEIRYPSDFAAEIYYHLLVEWLDSFKAKNANGDFSIEHKKSIEGDLAALRRKKGKTQTDLQHIWQTEAALLPPPSIGTRTKWADAGVSYLTWHLFSFHHGLGNFAHDGKDSAKRDTDNADNLPLMTDPHDIFRRDIDPNYWPEFLDSVSVDTTYIGRTFKEVVRTKLAEGLKTILKKSGS